MHFDEMMQRGPDDAIDRILRDNVRWHAPCELTDQLLTLIPKSPMVMNRETESFSFHSSSTMTVSHIQPQTWYAFVVMVLTSITVGLSCTIAWHMYGVVGYELGLEQVWGQFQMALATGLEWVYSELPFARSLETIVTSVYQQLSWLLNWVLVACILWLALDGYAPPASLQHHQTL